ncbi:DUF2157 domain-containing protein [Phyllobacterium pellucidum]|uniref:DUF2157 domain-containing protein n=1 Tax=Phyllobacterium pellucidum TaxID=2740464 RepID=UPI001D1375C1|nr:DUF2157 domain-containing protein [Phyllobacterium sp. T1018]UGY08813.1 DUF2157 domain-containing protein [Phyllobacterium sp. T1018]
MAITIGVKKHIARWQRDGLIDETTAERLRKDMDGRGHGLGLGGVLAVLGAVLLGAAIVSLVAANWELMPRLVRLGLIISVIGAGYIGGAWRASLGDRIFSEALYLIAAITFGAGIGLVGQMYHLSGDTTDAALLWVAGTMVAALLLRSKVLTSTSVAITGFYLFASLEPSIPDHWNYIWLVPVLAITCAGLVWWTKAKQARHFIAILLIAYVFVVRFDLDDQAILWIAAVLGAALFLADALRSRATQQLTGWSEAIGGYGFIMLVIALIFFQFDEFSEGVANQVAIGFAILGCSVAGLALSGHRNLAVRWVSYTVFSLEVLYLAFKTIGTLIGTAGFFLTAGILVLLLAAFVVRMERRLLRKNPKKEATA